MTDNSAADQAAAAMAALRAHGATYIASGGTRGHIFDMRMIGGPELGTHCLIRTKVKSGRTQIVPLSYLMINGEVTICASRGGAPTHPAWYLNLVANPEIEFQIATQAWRGTWREPEGAERQGVWDTMAWNYPFYTEYQGKTDRKIPLVMMRAVEEIAVFTAE